MPYYQSEQRQHVHPVPDSADAMDLKNLTQAIENFFNPAGKQYPDIALLFFAGHGLSQELFGDYESYLAAVNSNPDAEIWGYPVAKLQKLLKASPISRKIVWLDACYSGALTRDFPNLINSEYCLISAAPDHDVAKEKSQQGVLTKALLEALDTKNCEQKTVTSHDLVQKLEVISQRDNIQQMFTYKNSDQPLLLTGEHFIPTEETLKICPYKGLNYFDYTGDDPKLYFGRGKETERLLNLVINNRLVMVLGASGSGKSSLVRAGLVHKLQIGNLTSGSWHILPIIRPVNQAGDLPLNNLEQAKLQQKTKQNNLLIVDQFEEIFTLVSDRDQQNQFFQYLFAQEKVYRVIVMRSDFFPHTQNHRELAQKA